MKKILLFLLSVSFFLFAMVSSAAAVVIYSQPYNGGGGGFLSNLGPGLQQEAENFVLDQDSYILDVHWWGFPGDLQDNFLFRFFEDVGGSPADAHFAQVAPVGFTKGPDATNPLVYYYEADLSSPVFATGGDTYYISILNNGGWTWSITDNAPGDHWVRLAGDSSAWILGAPFELAFELTGSPIPEPATMLLLGSGLAGLAGFRKRFKKR